MRSIEKVELTVALLYVIIWVLGVIGWVANIYQLITGFYGTGYLVVKVVGVFLAPLGAVLGYVGLL